MIWCFRKILLYAVRIILFLAIALHPAYHPKQTFNHRQSLDAVLWHLKYCYGDF